MIKSVMHKGLKEVIETSKSRRIRQDQVKRIIRLLNILEATESLDDLNLPSLNFHSLHTKPTRYAISVNGPWRLTFEWNSDIYKLNLEQYH